MLTNEPFPSAEGDGDREMSTVINVTADAEESNNHQTNSSSESTQQATRSFNPNEPTATSTRSKGRSATTSTRSKGRSAATSTSTEVGKMPFRSDDPLDPRNCRCRSLSRHTYDKFLGQVIVPLIPKDEWDIDFADKDFTSSLPGSTGTPRLDNNFKVLRHIFLFLPFDTETLLAAAGVNSAWRALADRLPHWKYLLPLKCELPEIVARLNWHLPRIFFIDRIPYDFGEQEIYRTNYYRSSKPFISDTFHDTDFHHSRLRQLQPNQEGFQEAYDALLQDTPDGADPHPPVCSVGTWCDFLCCLPCSLCFAADRDHWLARKSLIFQNEADSKQGPFLIEDFKGSTFPRDCGATTTVCSDGRPSSRRGLVNILATSSTGEYKKVYDGLLKKVIDQQANLSSQNTNDEPATSRQQRDIRPIVYLTSVEGFDGNPHANTTVHGMTTDDSFFRAARNTNNSLPFRCFRATLLEFVDEIMTDPHLCRQLMFPTLSDFCKETRQLVRLRKKEVEKIKLDRERKHEQLRETTVVEICVLDSKRKRKTKCTTLPRMAIAWLLSILLLIFAIFFPSNIDQTIIPPTDVAVGGVTGGLIAGTFAVVTLGWFVTSGCRYRLPVKLTSWTVLLYLWMFLLIPLSLLSFRVSIFQSMMSENNWIVSVDDICKHDFSDEQLSNSSFLDSLYESYPPKVNGSSLLVPLHPSLLPVRDIRLTSFVHFPPGTQFLYHPRTTTSRPVPFLARLNKTTGITTTFQNHEIPLPYFGKPSWDRAFVGYYTVLVRRTTSEEPSDTTHRSTPPNHNFTFAVYGDFKACPFWSSHESFTIHRRFEPVLQSEAREDAIDKAMNISAHIGAKVVGLNTSTVVSCSHPSNLLVTVKNNTNFHLRTVNKPTPHFTSWTKDFERRDANYFDALKSATWSTTTAYSEHGVMGLMADSSILIAHNNFNSHPHRPELLPSPFGGGEESGAKNPSVWTQATPEGLEKFYSDYLTASIVLGALYCCLLFYVSVLHNQFARQLTRRIAVYLTWGCCLIFPAVGFAVGIVCHTRAVQWEKVELLQPVYCLGGRQEDFDSIVWMPICFFYAGIILYFTTLTFHPEHQATTQSDRFDTKQRINALLLELVPTETEQRNAIEDDASTESAKLTAKLKLRGYEIWSLVAFIRQEQMTRYFLTQESLLNTSALIRSILQEVRFEALQLLDELSSPSNKSDPQVWLHHLMSQYFPDTEIPEKLLQSFRQHHIDYEAFLLLTKKDLKEIGVPIGLQVKLIHCSQNLNEERRSSARSGQQFPHPPQNNPHHAAAAAPVVAPPCSSSSVSSSELVSQAQRTPSRTPQNTEEATF